MKRKAAARSRPVSRGKFSLNGGHRNRGGVGRPTFVSHCSANDPSIMKGTTKNSLSYTTRDRCCDEVANKITTDTSQGEYLNAKVGLYVKNQDTSAAVNVTKECSCAYVEYKNGQHGAPYETYSDYLRRIRSECTATTRQNTDSTVAEDEDEADGDEDETETDEDETESEADGDEDEAGDEDEIITSPS